jgi:transmembrane sensor
MEDLIIRSLGGHTSPAEDELLRAWRAASPGNEATYWRTLELWSLLGRSSVAPRERSRPLAAELLARAAASRVPPPVASRRRRRLWIPAGAATAALLALAIGLSWLISSERDPSLDPFGTVDLATGPSETVTLRLGDGSIATVAPDSRIEIATAGGRSVRLQGQAYFAVTADSTRPFTVHTPTGAVQVLGTRFHVQGDTDVLKVAVLEGRVAVASADVRVEITEGEMALAGPNEAPLVFAVDDIYAVVQWMGHRLGFQATPLAKVAAEIERRFAATVTLEGTVVAARAVTGWFADQSFEEVVTAICQAVDAACRIGPRHASIRAR